MLVLLKLNLDYDIAWLNIGDFIAFTMDSVLLAMWSSLIDLHFQDFLLCFDFLTQACLALLRWIY
jgi:hypothetical protein